MHTRYIPKNKKAVKPFMRPRHTTRWQKIPSNSFEDMIGPHSQEFFMVLPMTCKEVRSNVLWFSYGPQNSRGGEGGGGIQITSHTSILDHLRQNNDR